MSRKFEKAQLYKNLWDDEVFQEFPPIALEKIAGLVWEFHPSECMQDLDRPAVWEALFCFTYSLMADGGLFRNQSLNEIFQLKKCHLLTLPSGRIEIPRAEGICTFDLPGPALVLGLSFLLILHRGRTGAGGKNRLGTFPDDGYLLPGCRNELDLPNKEEMKFAENLYRIWLGEVSLKAIGQEISLGTLGRLSSGKWFHNCPPLLVAYVSGIHLIHPMPVDQSLNAEDDNFMKELLNSSPRSKKRIKKSRVPHFAMEEARCIAANRPRTLSQKLRGQYSVYFDEIKRIILPYIKLDKDQVQGGRPKTKYQLAAFEARRLESLGSPSGLRKKMTWKKFFDWHGKKAWLPFEIAEVNAFLFSKWMSSKFNRGKAPKTRTLHERLYGILNISRFLPVDMLLTDIDTRMLQWIFEELDRSDKGKMVLLDSLKNFRSFAAKYLPVVKIDWEEFSGGPFSLHPQPLITHAMLEQAIKYLLRNELNSRTITVALLLGFYFGLRVSEMTHLKLGDIHLTGTPTVFIYRSKNDKNRIIEIDDLPEIVRKILTKYYKQRLAVANKDLQKPFLVNLKKERYRTQTLSNEFDIAFTACNVDTSVGEKRASAHILRHSCANRWLEEGIPLTEVTRRLGHASAETTLTYIHCLSQLQRKYIRSLPDEIGFPIDVRMGAVLAGLSMRGIFTLRKSRALKEITTYHGLFCWLLEFFPASFFPLGDNCI